MSTCSSHVAGQHIYIDGVCVNCRQTDPSPIEQILGRPGPLTAPVEYKIHSPVSYRTKGVDANGVVTMSHYEGDTVTIKTVGILMNMSELKALASILTNQYIAYDNQPAHEVVNKIFRILKENEN